MKKSELPILVYEIAFLQAYLYELFSLEGHCEQNFDRTIWHLKEKHSDDVVKSVIEFFKDRGLKYDCDVIYNLDLREISKQKMGFHDEDKNMI
jgi:hypothetical protein